MNRDKTIQIVAKRDNTQNYVAETIRCIQVADLHQEGRHDICNRVYSTEGTSPTLNTCGGGGLEPKILCNSEKQPKNFRIRRLTPRECYRLMDVDEDNINRLLDNPRLARTKHYHLAGNSIVVACLEHIFRRLFIDPEPKHGEQMLLF